MIAPSPSPSPNPLQEKKDGTMRSRILHYPASSFDQL